MLDFGCKIFHISMPVAGATPAILFRHDATGNRQPMLQRCVPAYLGFGLRYGNFDVVEAYHLAVMNFAGFAKFLMPVDRYSATGDEHFSGTAAVADADQFEKLVQLDVFTA
jgi:hypothetical protein